MISQWEEIESFHLFDDELGSFPLFSHGEGELQEVVLDGSSVAGNVDDVIESSASSQSDHDFFVEACPRWIEYGYNFIPSILVADLLDQIFSSAQMHFIGLGVLLGVFHCFLADLDSDHFDVWQFVLN